MSKTIASGRYEPDTSVEVISWPRGKDVPEGFSRVTAQGHVSQDGRQQHHAVRKLDNGDVERDEHGNAVAVHEGEAVAIHADGRVERIEDVQGFAKRHGIDPRDLVDQED